MLGKHEISIGFRYMKKGKCQIFFYILHLIFFYLCLTKWYVSVIGKSHDTKHDSNRICLMWTFLSSHCITVLTMNISLQTCRNISILQMEKQMKLMVNTSLSLAFPPCRPAGPYYGRQLTTVFPRFLHYHYFFSITFSQIYKILTSKN